MQRLSRCLQQKQSTLEEESTPDRSKYWPSRRLLSVVESHGRCVVLLRRDWPACGRASMGLDYQRRIEQGGDTRFGVQLSTPGKIIHQQTYYIRIMLQGHTSAVYQT